MIQKEAEGGVAAKISKVFSGGTDIVEKGAKMVGWANGLAYGLAALTGATAGLLASKVTSPSSSIENTGDHIKDLALSQSIVARDAAMQAQPTKNIPAKQRHIPFVE